MTTGMNAETASWWKRIDATNVEGLMQAAILVFIVVNALAGAFSHMHDWTADALPKQSEVLDWSNAMISELLPMSSFLSLRQRQRQNRLIKSLPLPVFEDGTVGEHKLRSTGVPVVIFMASAVLSMCAQLHATGLRFLHDAQFLACLPAIALLILSKVIFSDVEFAAKIKFEARVEAERNAEQAAEQARNEAAEREAERQRNAEREAERQRKHEAQLAAEAAEREERLRREESERAERLAEIEQQAITDRERLAAEERAAERRDRLAVEERDWQARRAAEERERAQRLEIERQAAATRAAAEAEALRVEAEALARKADAETARLETETRLRDQAVSRLTGRTASVGEGGGAAPRAHAARPVSAPPAADFEAARAARRTREETQVDVELILAGLPAGTDRATAVKVVMQELSITDRSARSYVPSDWTAGSAGGSSEGDGGDGVRRSAERSGSAAA